MIDLPQFLRDLESDGCALLAKIVPEADCQAWGGRLANLADAAAGDSVRKRGESLYAVRNLMDVCPETYRLWARPELVSLLTAVLGRDFGLVRGLLFDKPPEVSWAVPWHQDLTITVQPPMQLSPQFSTPRLKSGVWHCEAPTTVLQRMLALRIHLDDVTDVNGPLEVAPGTHRTGKTFDLTGKVLRRIHARAGDVLAMRPLMAHASPKSHPRAEGHRRVVHLEFSADRELPDGYRWHRFVSPTTVMQ